MRKVIQAVELGCADCPRNSGYCNGKNCIRRFKVIPIKTRMNYRDAFISKTIISFVSLMLLVGVGIPLTPFIAEKIEEQEYENQWSPSFDFSFPKEYPIATSIYHSNEWENNLKTWQDDTNPVTEDPDIEEVVGAIVFLKLLFCLL